MLKEQIQLLQSTRYPRSELPPGGWEVFLSPRQVQSAKQSGPPYPGLSEMPYQRFPATASLRGGEGPPAKSAQLPPQPVRQKGRQHPQQPPPPSPHPATLSPPCHGPVPRAAAAFLLLLAIPAAQGQQLTLARSDLSCVKRGQFSAPLHQTHPGMGEEVAGATPSDVPG